MTIQIFLFNLTIIFEDGKCYLCRLSHKDAPTTLSLNNPGPLIRNQNTSAAIKNLFFYINKGTITIFRDKPTSHKFSNSHHQLHRVRYYQLATPIQSPHDDRSRDLRT